MNKLEWFTNLIERNYLFTCNALVIFATILIMIFWPEFEHVSLAGQVVVSALLLAAIYGIVYPMLVAALRAVCNHGNYGDED